MKLHIVRHGETHGNVNGLMQGQLDLDFAQLTPNGIDQAKKLGNRFKDLKIDVIYSSDLKRAVETSKEIKKYFPDLKLKIDKRIRERNYGEFEGKQKPNEKIDYNNPKNGVESNKELYERIKDFLEFLIKNHKDQNIVVVCHGGTKRAMLTILENLNEKTNVVPLNTSVSLYEMDNDNNFKPIYVNDISHL